MTENRKSKASMKYDKTHTTMLMFKLNNETDSDIINKLDSVDNKQGYVKKLIRDDIANDERHSE